MKPIIVESAECIFRFCRLMMHEKKDLPIRSSEMGLLILTVKSETAITPVMAANYFMVSKPMVAAMVRSLEQKGYLEKRPSAQDGRSFILQATKSGRQLVDSAYSEYYRTMELLQQRMGTETFQTLTGLLDQANSILLEEKNNG